MRPGDFASVCLLLMSTGCRTTLDNYKCEAQIDCIGERVGRCEPSRHCSFPDSTCTSGFRYGESSGADSDSCVANDTPSIDAGNSAPMVDANLAGPMRPLAVINSVNPECGVTTSIVDGAASVAYKGANIVNLDWTITGPGGMELDRFSGEPFASIVPGTHRQGGVYEFPEINLPDYHGSFVFLEEPRSGGGVLDILLHDGIVLPADADTLQLYFSIASQTTTGSATVALRTANSEVATLTVETETVMKSHLLNISLSDVNITGIEGPFRIRFSFLKQERYYIDNLALTNPAGVLYTDNESAETTTDPWYTANPNTSPREVKRVLLPSSLRQAGSYQLSLVVRDSNGLESLPTSREINVSHNCL